MSHLNFLALAVLAKPKADALKALAVRVHKHAEPVGRARLESPTYLIFWRVVENISNQVASFSNNRRVRVLNCPSKES